jgi:hypothetical protein
VTTPQNQGRVRGFDVLDQTRYWDHATAGVVLERLAPSADLAFFRGRQIALARTLLAHLLDQFEDPSVPVLELIDTRLARGETDGWHYADMPEDGEAWRQTLAWLDDDAHGDFVGASRDDQAKHIQHVQDLAHRGEPWHDWSAERTWSLWTRYATTAFYSHPWAWNEIGFPGPAYPRGYLNLGVDRREHWEKPAP